MSKNNVNILRLDTTNPNKFSSLEIITSTPKNLSIDQLKVELLEISKFSVDAAFKRQHLATNKRLIALIWTPLIQSEVIDEMAKDHGVEKEVSSITESAMNGELDFNESLMKRVSMLEGLEEKKLSEILERLEYTKGARELSMPSKTWVQSCAISGGFTFFANALKDKLALITPSPMNLK